eukprot:13028538-Alexandrium_andersonii.AAC.1
MPSAVCSRPVSAAKTPQTAIRPLENAELIQALGAGSARPQEQPHNCFSELPKVAKCDVLRARSESARQI